MDGCCWTAARCSKSKGNVVDPYLLAEAFPWRGRPALLPAHLPFGSDGNFSNESLINTINWIQPQHLVICSACTVSMVGQVLRSSVRRSLQRPGEGSGAEELILGRDRYESRWSTTPSRTPWRRSSRSSPGQQLYRRERPGCRGQGHGGQRRPPGRTSCTACWRLCGCAPSC